MNDALTFAIGLAMFVFLCWIFLQAGLLTRGADYTNAERAEDDAALDTIRDELDRQEGKTRKVRAVS